MGMDRRVFNAKPGFLIRNSILKRVHNLRGFAQSARVTYAQGNVTPSSYAARSLHATNFSP